MRHDLSKWEPVIGLEIHCELNTKSKLFSCAPNRFGDEPNRNITVVCTGQPGALPVLNREAVRKAVLFGCAIQADVQHFSKFDRKSYFYPDSPRNFQITQYDQPIIRGGVIEADVDDQSYRFEIDRVHLEDDAGMLKHFPGYAGVDYNRAGVPLIEIVSTPCMHSPRQASAYAQAVKAILEYIDVSDCNMEEGSLRFDANVSVRLKGETGFRPKVEIKNMNSFNFLELAVESEILRQIRIYSENPDTAPESLVQQATFRWDPEKGETVRMRGKETADDYRYFPEPDLVPIVLTDAYIEGLQSELPELPRQRFKRYVEQLDLSPSSAATLTSDKATSDFFEAGLEVTDNARSLCNWMIVEFAARLRDRDLSLTESGIQPENIGRLVNLIDSGTITGKIAKKVADDMMADPGRDCEDIVRENPDYQPLEDTGEIEGIIDRVILDNHQSVSDFRSGKNKKAFGFLVGQVMKASKGKASPAIVNEILKAKLEG